MPVMGGGIVADPRRQRHGVLSSDSAAAFSPYTLATSKYSWRADAQAFSDGDPISTLTASIGGVNMTQSGGNRPTWKANIKNGKPAILFDDTASQFLKTATSALSLAQPLTIYMVAMYASGGVSSSPFFYDAFGSVNRIGSYINSGKFECFNDLDIGGTVAAAADTWYVFAHTANNTSSNVYVNGSLSKTGNGGTRNLTDFSIGRRDPTTNNYLKGYIAEVLIGEKDDSNFANIINYLGSKYAITVTP